MLLCYKNSCSLHIDRPVEGIPCGTKIAESRIQQLEGQVADLIKACNLYSGVITDLEAELARKDEDNTSLLTDAIATIDKQRAELARKDEALKEIKHIAINALITPDEVLGQIADKAREGINGK